MSLVAGPFHPPRAYPSTPYVPTQSPGGGGGGGDGVGGGGPGGVPAPPRKIPAMVVGQPLTQSPVMRTVPPAGTSIGKCSQAPALYEPVMGIDRVVVP